MSGPGTGNTADTADTAGTAGPGDTAGTAGERPSRDGDDALAGRVRPYALTGGRTRSATDLPLETLVRRTVVGISSVGRLTFERRRIIDLCDQPVSIAELSAHLDVHLGVARVLVGDMTAEGYLDVYRPRPVGDRPDIKLLERVLDGLQAL